MNGEERRQVGWILPGGKFAIPNTVPPWKPVFHRGSPSAIYLRPYIGAISRLAPRFLPRFTPRNFKVKFGRVGHRSFSEKRGGGPRSFSENFRSDSFLGSPIRLTKGARTSLERLSSTSSKRRRVFFQPRRTREEEAFSRW